ncbi:transposase [Leekyejoonella antrihumi]|uniref:DDE transposase n=1 Tax=Leekyejoonella antrihumi TaxID=1660198 RepID=A0A563DUX3_9MICO|nr:DDE transposase [Leekyejoonella antrihumi]
MLDWLGEDHLLWFVIEAVNRLDTTAFHRLAKRGGVGRRGYDPDMVLTLFVYAMAHGVSSSRQMERLCETDVAFRVICAQDTPDHTVLARFRKSHQDALAGLLTESLVLAAELGMVSLGTVALDGTKIAGNASRDANRSETRLRELAESYLGGVEASDEAEDVLFGEEARGDELPAQARDRSGRRQRIEAALEQISARRQQDEQAQEERAERVTECERAVAEGRKGRGRYPAGADRVAMAKARWEGERAAAAERYQSWQSARERGEPGRRGRRPAPPEEHYRVRNAWATYEAERAAAAAPQAGSPPANAGSAGQHEDTSGRSGRFAANVTDPDSRLLKTRNGWIQGYNCQTAASDDEFILYARATQDANDLAQFIPTMNAVTSTAQMLATRTGRQELNQIGTLLADAGYDFDANLAADGPDRLIADGKRHKIAARVATDPATGDPPENATAREKMNHRLRTTDGHDLYKRRSPMIETPNAWLKDGRGLRRFARRGLDAVQAELCLACAVTNLLKLATKGVTATQLQTA